MAVRVVRIRLLGAVVAMRGPSRVGVLPFSKETVS